MKYIHCPKCGEKNLAHARFCCMCGINIEEAKEIEIEAMRNGVIPLSRRHFSTEHGEKRIEVYCQDITQFHEKIDILILSAFRYNYAPVDRTIIGALQDKLHLSVEKLAEKPLLDLRKHAFCWLSDRIEKESSTIKRIGCVEMVGVSPYEYDKLSGIRNFFSLLDIADSINVEMNTIALPILGAGSQSIDSELVVVPLVNEAVNFLKRNSTCERIIFIERNFEKARLLANTIKSMYQLTELSMKHHKHDKKEEPYAFISYTTKGDSEVAELFCHALKDRNIRYWYAPEDIQSGRYAKKIVEAINECTHFICIISENSMNSQHVLNEIDLAFKHLNDGIVILPYRLDGKDNPLKAEFEYYLSRMNWNYGTPPPVKDRIDEFVDRIFNH